MSILTDELPDYIVVGETKHPIKTDFKVWLKFSQLIGNGFSDITKIVDIFKILFDELPPNMLEALKVVFEFYSHSAKDDKKSKGKEKKKVFDFEYDADLIYSSFMQQYKIDLTEASMHWWKFQSLFGNLSEDTRLMEVIKYRSVKLCDIKDKKQRKFYAKMKAMYKLPDNRSEEQKETDLISAFESMFG